MHADSQRVLCDTTDDDARAQLDALVASCVEFLGQHNVFQARQSFYRATTIRGVDRSKLADIAAELGAAEAAMWLRRFAEGVVPTRAEFGDMTATVGMSLAAWLSPDLANERRWELFDQAGGDRATLSNGSLQSLAQLTKALQSEGPLGPLDRADLWR